MHVMQALEKYFISRNVNIYITHKYLNFLESMRFLFFIPSLLFLNDVKWGLGFYVDPVGSLVASHQRRQGSRLRSHLRKG